MAVQNLEIAVDVDISDAIAALESLQSELEDLADKIDQVDARGAEGIDVTTNIEGVAGELASVKGQMEAFEASESLDIETAFERAGRGFSFGGGADPFRNFTGEFFDQDLGSLAGVGGGEFNQPRGQPGMLDDALRGLAGADLDFGGFNVPRGQGIGDDDGPPLEALQDLSKRVSSALGELDDFNLRMSDLHNLMASLVPILIVFIGAIPAAVTALLTLAGAALTAAAAFLAIGGFGALGFAMEGGEFNADKLKEAMMEVRDGFLEAFAPLAERLQPLFEDALDGLEVFFQRIANQGDALVALTDEARSFGQFLTEFVPSALRTLAGLVEALAPVFGELGDFIQTGFTDIVREFLMITLESLPALTSLAHNLAGVAKFLARAGIGFAAVASGIIKVLSVLGVLLDFLGFTDESIGLLIGTILTAVSALALLNLVTGTFITSALSALISWSFVAAKSILGLQASFWQLTIAELAAAGALATLIAVGTLLVGIGLVAFVSKQASQFLNLRDSIDAATSSMQEFNRVSGNGGTDGINPFGGAPSSGAGQRGGLGGSSGGGTTINVESTGDKEQDNSNVQKAQWYMSRNSGNRA